LIIHADAATNIAEYVASGTAQLAYLETSRAEWIQIRGGYALAA
jgi:hypothetical protein